MMLLTLMKQVIEKGLLCSIDLQLAQRLIQFENHSDPLLFILIVWLSEQTRQGHVCIKPATLSANTLFQGREIELAEAILQEVNRDSIVHWKKSCSNSTLVSGKDGLSPLIMQNDRLYLQRMWRDETHVADYFDEKSRQKVSDPAHYPFIASLLNQLFPDIHSSQIIDQQKIAAAMALTNPLTIISGGPGTGKTTTVAKILAGLIKLDQKKGPLHRLRIIIAAPTGKAAARLTESLNKAVLTLPLTTAEHQLIPQEALTLHRLLGAKKNSRFFKYNASNLLHVDVLIIDEASMIDLSMMASLIEALPDNVRLILLGDRDQLSSVEAGSVLNDLCYFSQQGYSKSYAKQLSELTGYSFIGHEKTIVIQDSLCLLTKSYRFSDTSGVGKLAVAINQGRYDEIKKIISQNYNDIEYIPFLDISDYQQCLASVLAGYRHYLTLINSQSPQTVLTAFNQFQLLCALRQGDFGVEGLNQHIERLLIHARLITLKESSVWYAGRPVMIRRNNHEIGLFNGDIGITLYDKISGKLMVYFMLAGGEIKGFSPNRLPEHETAYAMTVHQSQGSEFNEIVFILPNHYTPILTRELVYTAVTRAKEKLLLCADAEILKHAVNTLTQRESGLVEQLMAR